jgi:hypothetical protein
MSPPKHRPRITFEVTEKQYNVLKENLDYGLQRKFFEAIVDDVVPVLEEFGYAFVLAMLDKRFSYRRLMIEQSRQSTD